MEAHLYDSLLACDFQDLTATLGAVWEGERDDFTESRVFHIVQDDL